MKISDDLDKWLEEYSVPSGVYHVVPIDDMFEHLTDTTKNICWCNPVMHEREIDIVYIHTSFDGREFVDEINEDASIYLTISKKIMHKSRYV